MKRTLLVLTLILILAMTACTGGSRSTGTPNTPPAGETESARPTQAATSAPEATSEPGGGSPLSPPTGDSDSGPVMIQGSFTFTNDIILIYYTEHAAALVDMYGFVTRDREWEMPVEAQVLGFLEMDKDAKTANYQIQLPLRPTGRAVDVNPDGKEEAGVQVFSASYWPNLTGGPYSEGDDPSRGWPSYLASVKADTENKDEVIGGKLVIWAPNEAQFFPSEFGADGLLFTDDDPVMPVPAGYSVIDLDQKPFAITREEMPDLTLYEPGDVAVKDYSELSYTEAFDNMFEVVRKEYAFNGIEDKQPDYDALYAELSPRVKEADANKDAEAFYLAMRDFTRAFKDGHVGLSGGDIGAQVQQEETAGGYGFAIRELDDGKVIAVYVMEGGPAAAAGMETGAEITRFNGKAIREAIGEVVPANAPHSTDFGLRFYQAVYLVRAPVGTEAQVAFINPATDAQPATEQTAELAAVEEQESLFATSLYRNYDPNALPVEYIVASSLGVGYVKVNSNYDDLNLVIRLFQRALEKFEENGIQTLIIDMRANSGGANLGLAGFLTDQEIELGQLQYYSEATGSFESERPVDKVIPNQTQFRFNKMFLLIDQACASACELESYGFSQVPGMEVIGHTPTAGVEAEVARGQFELPEGMSLQVPTGRFILPDGSLFLEGQGVQPTVRVPVTADNAFGDQDAVLNEAIARARGQ